MNFPLYLAMTGQEIANSSALPQAPAYLGCCFSQSGSGLSGLPEELPKGWMLILDDRHPFQHHDPGRIAEELGAFIREQACESLLLDFQRPDCQETAMLASCLTDTLPCPVAVSHYYGTDHPGPVFLPPIPPDCPVQTYLAPWRGKEIWLEASCSPLCLNLTESGCTVEEDWAAPVESGLPYPVLHCRYRVETLPQAARFYLWRTRKDLDALMLRAASLGVTRAVGLWQELG